ncbi:MAG TPA: pyridoxamine 5'-phosphate oxidase family protein [Candidatus Sulfomarinibacteraceae bacterium]|nr:pyridoxamine 5'-phosphate oxidase family protein [Candidatus Sulfomarinibacteraceae bacterium]
MSRDYKRLCHTHIRRSDRAIDDEEWIRAFLGRAAYGHFAIVQDGQPFINSNLFVYDAEAHAIFFHTARTGRTPANVGDGARVCFTTTEMGRLLPADVALEFSVEYAGVVAFGAAAIVRDEKEATRALQMLLDKYFPHLQPGRDYRPPVAEELKRTAVYRLQIEEWSAKKKEVGDFPGSFYYDAQTTR